MKKKLLDLKTKAEPGVPGNGIRIKEISSREIAVTGIAVRLAHYDDTGSLWKDLIYGVDRVGPLPRQRRKDANRLLHLIQPLRDSQPHYKEMAYLDRIDHFDAGFFRISPKDAATLDPAQRLFLETAWRAVEDAGYGGDRLKGGRVGVFVGSGSLSQYMDLAAQLQPQRVNTVFTGNVPSNLAGRISYLMDWHGPAALIDTACSSSLVAVHQACRALRHNECQLALAGAVKVSLTPLASEEKIEIESSDQRTHAFDQNSDGTGGGEGVLAVLLKPLHQAIKDKDNIYAIIKGSAVNQDGNSAGITVPNASAQAEVIRRAWKDADIDPMTISYIETHGTGTSLGDPIEIDGITKAFDGLTNKKQFCALGAVKSNFGHLDNAAGLLGMVKAILCLRHRQIPPIVHFKEANKRIPFEQSPVFVPKDGMAWERTAAPRRCGVSSFGLSGINCHMILEEAPQPPPARTKESDKPAPFLLVLSGRDEQALERYIEAWRYFLSARPGLDLHSLCGTAATGRGHYSHRLALIFNNRNQLDRQLDRLARHGLPANKDIDENSNIYYGTFTVIPDNAPSSGAGVLTRSQWNQLNGEADPAGPLTDIAQYYVRGADIDWQSVYHPSRNPFDKLSIPPYPQEKRRCWLTIPESPEHTQAAAGAAALSSIYSGSTGQGLVFLRFRLAETPEQTIYSIRLDADSFWLLKNHKVMGIPTLVGTAYYQLLFEAARLHGIHGALAIRGLMIRQPLQIPAGESQEVLAIVKPGAEKTLALELTAKSGEQNRWLVFGSAHIAEAGPAHEPEMDLRHLRESYKETLVDVSKETTADDPMNPVEAGPRWKCLKRIWRGEEDGCPVTLGYLELAPEFSGDIKEFALHPPLLDAALHLGLSQPGYLPMTAPEVSIHRPSPSKVFCLVKETSADSAAEVRQFDILLTGQDGKLIAEWLGYTVKRLRLESQNTTCHYILWRQSPLPPPNDNNQILEKEKVVLLVGGSRTLRGDIGTELRKRPGRAKILETGMEDYLNMVPALEREKVDHLLFLQALDVPVENSAPFLENTFIHLFRLLRAIIQQGITRPIRILAAAMQGHEVSGNESFLLPENALLAGLCKVAPQESPNLTCGYIDVDQSITATALIDELFHRDSSRSAYRESKRFEEEVETLELNRREDREKPAVKENGVYLISGGYGAMGLAFARYLATVNRVRIALLGRSRNHSPQTASIARQIQSIEETGCVVLPLSADVADETELSAALQEIHSQWGKINGIFHCAGIAGDGFLFKKEEDQVNGVLRPKVQGTRLLDRLTRRDEPDFMVLCASMTGITGAPGQSDYTAANAFLDAFAESRSKQGLLTMAIDWPAWLDQGMAANSGYSSGPGITTPEALNILDQLLHRPALPASVLVIPAIPVNREKPPADQPVASAQPPIQVTPEGREDGGYSSLEKTIAVIWGRILGYDRVNIYHNYYDLGGDSINALEIRNAIANKLKRDVSVADIFNHLTVARLAAHLDAHLNDTPDQKLPILEAVEPREYYPASAAQRRLYVFWKLAKDTTAYNLPTMLAVKGQPDIQRLEESFRRLIAAHESLRTSFEDRWGELVQVIARPEEIHFTLPVIEVPEEQLENRLKAFVKPFDLYHAPLFRAELVRTADKSWCVLIYDVHHIAADAMSLGILNRRLTEFYLSKEPPEPEIHYKDFAVWQEKLFESGELEKQEQYWLSQFETVPPILEMPLDFPRPPVQTFAGDSVDFAIGPERLKAIRALALELQTTPFNIFLSAWFILLHKAARSEDIVIAVADNGRVDPKLHGVIGMFINNLPIRAFPKADKTTGEFIEEVKVLTLQSQANQQYPFDQLVSRLDLPRDLSRNPLTDIVFSYMNFDQTEIDRDGNRDGNILFEPYGAKLKDSSKFDMSIFATETSQDVIFAIEYYSDIFTAGSMERLSRYYLELLSGMAAGPGTSMGNLSLMPPQELKRLLDAFNDTAADYPAQKSLDQLFRRQVEKSPSHIALIGFEPGGNRSYLSYWTYKELDRQANLLAQRLLEKGAALESVIALKLTSSPRLIITILAILKAGGIYLPIDPAYPRERIEYVLRDSNAALFIDDSGIHEGPGAGGHSATHQPLAYPAYIMYTSGSTGKPKGVVVPHRAVIRLVINTSFINIIPRDRIMQTGSPAFDATTFETWGALLNGASLLVPPDEATANAVHMKKLTHRFGITIMWLTSGLFNHLVQTSVTIFEPLKTLLVGGEKLSASHIAGLRDVYPDLKVLNGYGPTENTTFTTTFNIDRHYEGDIPIGSPIANTSVLILDQSGLPVPPGIPGEILCGGHGLALGYLNQPELTVSRFLPLAAKTLFEKRGADDTTPQKLYRGLRPGGQECVQSEARYYRTGDLGLWLPDGNIRFLGRLDQQVKIRGFRVELGEIEVQLLRCPDITEAVVIDWPTSSGTLDLVAYIVSDRQFNVALVRECLDPILPDYMVPGHVIQMEKLPLTVQGKLDRRALPEPGGEVSNGDQDYMAPRDEIEQKLIAIWEQVLDLSPLGIRDNFFDRGGHSLKATQVISRVHRELGVEISLKQLFMEPSVEGLARRVREQKDKSFSAIPAAAKAEHYPVSYAQQRLWILHQMKGAAIAYNIPAALEFYDTIDAEALDRALKLLIERHQTLRTGFIKVKGELRQKIVENPGFELKNIDFHASGQGGNRQEVVKRTRQLADLDFKTPFDLAAPPLLRATLIKKDKKAYVLLLTIHHIIADGWSLRVLLRELPILYQACLEDRPTPLPPLTIQYKDFVVWQRSRDFEKQENYWLERLRGAPQALALPYDSPPGQQRDYAGDTLYLDLPAEITEPLRQLAKHVNTTFGSVFLSIFMFFLHWLTKQEDILVGMGIANRNHRELENLIGFFVNILPIRIRFYPGMEYEQLLDQVVQASYDGFENQDYPFDLLVRKLSPKRMGNRQPLLNVMFEYQSFSDINIQWEGEGEGEERKSGRAEELKKDKRNEEEMNLPGQGFEFDFKTSKFDITLFVVDQGGRVTLQMEYDTALFLPATVQRFMTYLERFSRKIAGQAGQLTRTTAENRT